MSCGESWKNTHMISATVSTERCPGQGHKWGHPSDHPTPRPRLPKTGSFIKVNGTQLHVTHKINWYAGVYICSVCGNHTTGSRVQNLAKKCNGVVAECYASVLKNFRKGHWITKHGKWPQSEDQAPPGDIQRWDMKGRKTHKAKHPSIRPKHFSHGEEYDTSVSGSSESD